MIKIENKNGVSFLKAEDVRGKPILKGFHVRYTGTGSTGEVIDLKSEDNENWILLDTTDLWYKTDSLEVINKSDYERIKNHTIFKTKNKEEPDKKEDIKGKIERSKNKFDDVDMSSELCDGGG